MSAQLPLLAPIIAGLALLTIVGREGSASGVIEAIVAAWKWGGFGPFPVKWDDCTFKASHFPSLSLSHSPPLLSVSRVYMASLPGWDLHMEILGRVSVKLLSELVPLCPRKIALPPPPPLMTKQQQSCTRRGLQIFSTSTKNGCGSLPSSRDYFFFPGEESCKCALTCSRCCWGAGGVPCVSPVRVNDCCSLLCFLSVLFLVMGLEWDSHFFELCAGSKGNGHMMNSVLEREGGLAFPSCAALLSCHGFRDI